MVLLRLLVRFCAELVEAKLSAPSIGSGGKDMHSSPFVLSRTGVLDSAIFMLQGITYASLPGALRLEWRAHKAASKYFIWAHSSERSHTQKRQSSGLYSRIP